MSFPVLNLDLLQAFVAVADCRSFTRAASTLNRTQSAISMQVKRLERQAGAELLFRSTAQVGLTPAGERLLHYARRMLVLNQEALGSLREHKLEGRVRLGIMDDYGMTVMPPLIAAFTKIYPNIHIEMETGLTAHMLTRLGRSFDLVIAMHPAGEGEGELLRREQAIWVSGEMDRAEHMNPLPIALSPEGCLFRKWAMDALDAANRPWRIAFVSHSLAAVEAIVLQGLAVTVVKSSTCPQRLRILSEADGMPALPPADIRLHRALVLPRPAILLAEHLTAALKIGLMT
ncbi:LysR family transcriptional regulator [Phyllobacterium endophyticum]|uniref:LysR family transcriptional regulator n=1 Tax=Phyllobacterium endophyticum TaxID=1149773 RepID=A0A2P7B083_9HYPH|nr:LysR family transcriptional regulator [Phyllobacterium endophyticum]PSH59887.1 LysR family transcriptional regulator [Phyllobacterium endophyticum]TYR42037.1 LysR family transcriptional regulator [Phyllobacterium endophyticum]